ncbi:MAG TPA: MBL fold metallo-hydrolase, partial [Bacteroidales bacterium]|nr:MBL fold metallo-hydrolase [Bacteroidales bacterium]
MKKFMYISVSIVAILSLATFVVLSQSRFGKLPKGERLERIKKSPNYKDGKFQNQSYTPTVAEGTSMAKVMYDFIFKKKIRVTPEDSIPSVKTDLKRLPPDKDVIVWFGHSSYLMQIDGKKILVDPVFSGHAGPFRWMVKAFKGANQYSAADMPAIDYLVITHDHWDHLDYNTVVELKPRVKKVICGLGVGAHLEHWGFAPSSITEMDWYDQSVLDGDWKIIATPARHFSGRGLKRDQTLWASFVLQTPSLHIFIGGDGGYDK